jgi:hypothetical protein
MQSTEAGELPFEVRRARQLFAAVIARTDVDDLLVAQVLVIASRLEGMQRLPPPIPLGPPSADLVGDLEAAGRLLLVAASATGTAVEALLFAEVARDVRELIERLPAHPTPPP